MPINDTVRRQPARREPLSLPPTQSELTVAIYRLMDELALTKPKRSRPSEEETNSAAAKVFLEAEKSVMTAHSAVEAATMIVTAYQNRREKAKAKGNVIITFKNALAKARYEDLRKKAKLLEQLKDATDDQKAEIEIKLRHLLLRGAGQGKPTTLGENATAYLVEQMTWWFRPVRNSELEKDGIPWLVEEHSCFVEWLAVNILFNEEQRAAYASAKDEDKAAGAEASAEPAPETDADVEVESDEDGAEDEEQAAPAESANAG